MYIEIKNVFLRRQQGGLSSHKRVLEVHFAIQTTDTLLGPKTTFLANICGPSYCSIQFHIRFSTITEEFNSICQPYLTLFTQRSQEN